MGDKPRHDSLERARFGYRKVLCGFKVHPDVRKSRELKRRLLDERKTTVHDLKLQIRKRCSGRINVVHPVVIHGHRSQRHGLMDGDNLKPWIEGPLKYRKCDFRIIHMPSDDTVRRVAVRIKLEADRIQLFDLLLERVERLLWKYGINPSQNPKPPRPSFPGLPGFLYAAPAVLESVYRGDMMTGEIVIAFDE